MKLQKPTPGRKAFTLIELLTVIAIIAILAAMTVGIVGFAQKKASEVRTETIIAYIQGGLEQYRDKYGEYPLPIDNNGQGSGGAEALYQALCDDGDDLLFGGSTPSAGQVGEEMILNLPADGYIADNGNLHVVDGFGRPILYRVYDKANPDATNQKTYDLWSYGTDTTKKDEAKWIKNW